jgi:hypothetical protein
VHRLLVEGDVVGEEEHRRRRSDEAFGCIVFLSDDEFWIS